MALSNIRVKPLTVAIGAEIEGVDLSQPLSDDTFAAVHKALMDHNVIFFRDQYLTLEQHKDFGRLFGDLHIHPAAPSPEGHPEIVPIHADENSKYVAGGVDFQCRFRWENNSIAFWDNRCTQHHAAWDYFPNFRSGNRVAVQGERPV